MSKPGARTWTDRSKRNARRDKFSREQHDTLFGQKTILRHKAWCLHRRAAAGARRIRRQCQKSRETGLPVARVKATSARKIGFGVRVDNLFARPKIVMVREGRHMDHDELLPEDLESLPGIYHPSMSLTTAVIRDPVLRAKAWFNERIERPSRVAPIPPLPFGRKIDGPVPQPFTRLGTWNQPLMTDFRLEYPGTSQVDLGFSIPEFVPPVPPPAKYHTCNVCGGDKGKVVWKGGIDWGRNERVWPSDRRKCSCFNIEL